MSSVIWSCSSKGKYSLKLANVILSLITKRLDDVEGFELWHRHWFPAEITNVWDEFQCTFTVQEAPLVSVPSWTEFNMHSIVYYWIIWCKQSYVLEYWLLSQTGRQNWTESTDYSHNCYEQSLPRFYPILFISNTKTKWKYDISSKNISDVFSLIY